MFNEFKQFIARGNVMDLAVGVIMGSAFTAIVTSLTTNLINPFLGIFMGQVDFSSLVIKVGQATFRYGLFINAIINFLIIAIVVFFLVRAFNHFMAKPAEQPTPSNEEKYLKEIADLLKQQQSTSTRD